MNKLISIIFLLTGIVLPFSVASTEMQNKSANFITLKNAKQSIMIEPSSLKIDWYTQITDVPITESALLVEGGRCQHSCNDGLSLSR